MITLENIWLQIDSVVFHPLNNQEGRAQVKLQLFLQGFQSPSEVFPADGTQEILYGQRFAPKGGLFNAILPYGEFGTISFRVLAKDLNNPEATFCIPGPHGNEICFPAAPMSFSQVVSLVHNEFKEVGGDSSIMAGEKFDENFTLSGFALANPKIIFSGNRERIVRQFVNAPKTK